MVAMVGLGLGAASALYAYAAAGVITIAMAPSRRSSGLTLVDIVRFGAFVLGSPFVVLLALRADRQQLATQRGAGCDRGLAASDRR